MKASRLWCSRIRDEILSILLPEYKKRREDAIAAAKTSAAPSAASQADPFTGTWTGIVRTESGDIPLTLNAQASGDIHAKLGSQLETLLNRARFGNGRLSGIMTGDLGVGATAFNLYLFMRDGVLQGTAVSDPSPQLPHWVELKKTNSTRYDGLPWRPKRPFTRFSPRCARRSCSLRR